MAPSTSRSIVVGIDGSDASTAGLRWAADLVRSADDGSSISAVMAWNYPVVLVLPVVGTPLPPADMVADEVRVQLRDLVESTAGDLEIEQCVMMGAPRSVLCEASEDHDLLVIGRTGNSRLKQIFVGSTASYCVRHAACPVVIVRESSVTAQSITVAVDGSPSSIEALAWALRLHDEGEVLAVYSHDERQLDDLPLDDALRAELDASAHEVLAEAVNAAIERCGADPDRVTRQVVQGDPRTTLVDHADPSTLLVFGAQGHSGLNRWMLGSLADYAVQHAPGTVAIWREAG